MNPAKLRRGTLLVIIGGLLLAAAAVLLWVLDLNRRKDKGGKGG